MTDYAPAAEPSWTWWMAAGAMRIGQHHLRDDEYAGPSRKRQRVVDNEDDDDECWAYRRYDDDSATAGPLDLSVKAMTLTTAAAAARIIDARAPGTGVERAAATTPVKKSTAGATNGKSSKKTSVKTAWGSTASAVKAATRKLLPQLLMDHERVDRSSPVSGTIIVPATLEIPTSSGQRRSPCPVTTAAAAGAECDDDYDIDPEFNVVVATDEARRRLESIPNALGPYRCRLCSVQYADAFALARHRCRCIVHVRYRCPECDKVFQCPANLASHRRWHGTGTGTAGKTSSGNNNRGNKSVAAPEPAAQRLAAKPPAAEETAAATAVTDAASATAVTVSTAAVSSTIAAGFKKNILLRAVQAAAAAAAANNNNNDNSNNKNDAA